MERELRWNGNGAGPGRANGPGVIEPKVPEPEYLAATAQGPGVIIPKIPKIFRTIF